MDRLLVLLRHGQSEWNLKNLFTGWRNPPLTPRGQAEARAAGFALRQAGITFDKAFMSDLNRAQDTMSIALAAMGQSDLVPIANAALNERSYGELSGLNKDDARAKWGDHQVNIWRRSYDTPPPGGESLRDTVARTLPYYCQQVLPCVLRGEGTLVAAHGNSLRALVMVLDQLSPKSIPSMEILTGVPLVYRLGSDGLVLSKEVMETTVEA